MGKSTISMAIFNSYVKLPEGKSTTNFLHRVVELSEPQKSAHGFSIFSPRNQALIETNLFKPFGNQTWLAGKSPSCPSWNFPMKTFFSPIKTAISRTFPTVSQVPRPHFPCREDSLDHGEDDLLAGEVCVLRRQTPWWITAFGMKIDHHSH